MHNFLTLDQETAFDRVDHVFLFSTLRALDKQKGNLQQMMVHEAIVTNRYLVHLNAGTGEGCDCCSQTETVQHLLVQCTRLAPLYSQLVLVWENTFLFVLR